MFFVALGATCAAEITNASITEDSNLTTDSVNSLSQEKLEVSNEVSISETNIVNSHDDNLEDYPKDDSLISREDSYYEDNGEQVLGLANDADENLSVADHPSVLSVSSNDDTLSQSMATKLSVSNTHYGKSATYFKVTLQDSTGKALSNQKISLKVNSKTYSANTDKDGIATVKTAALAVGTYSVTVTYAGSGNYSSKSLTKNVKVLSSVTGNDLTKYYGDSTYYSATLWKDNERLSYTKVTFNVGGKKYTVTSNINGVAKFKAELNPGKYTITTTNPYTDEKLNNTLVVNKDNTNIAGKSKAYILMKNEYSYEVNLTTAHGSPVKDAKVYFSYGGKTVTATTDSTGKASIVIPGLERGTYNITYTFKGNTGLNASSSSGTLVVKYASNKLIASNLTMTYKDGSQFSVKLTDNKGNVLSGKTIKFTVNDKVSRVKTDSNGIAKLDLSDLKPGTYKVNYSYSSPGSSGYNYGSKNLVINKITLKISAGNLVMKYRDGSMYKATVKDSAGKVVKNVGVKFTIDGKTYTKKTDSKGVAKLKITCTPGNYPIKSYVSSSYYKSSAVNKKVVVNGTKFTAKDLYVANGNGVTYSVKVTDIKNKIVKGAVVKFTFKGKKYTRKTDSSGIAKVFLGQASPGNHKVHFAQDSSTGTRTIHVIHKLTLKQVISASQYVKNYVLDNSKLPSKIKIDKIEISTATYLYVASNAIIKLSSGKNSDYAYLKTIKYPAKAGEASDMGNLEDYLAVAKDVVKTANANGQMPNFVSSSLGDIGYKGLVYAFARVVAYYDDEGVMPSQVEITSLSDSSLTSKLNSKNTISDLAAYLAASTNCQVNNAKIKQLVTKLTEGLTSDKAKATAIYNYVRDAISYSFYYDTKYGAVGTLEAGSGNCVDHSHLLVAMYRTAGLPARYVHGTCTFTSGTYGHVWTQVLIGNTWVVSDATSSRNSFGNVVNWNADSYSLKGYYPSIAF